MNILVVNHDQSAAKEMGSWLKQHGYQTFFAADGQTALEVVAKEQPHVIICDIDSPTLTEYEVLDLLRARANALTILIAADPLLEVYYLEEGANDYLTKPITPERLLARVNALGRSLNISTQLLQVGHWTLDEEAREITCGGKRLKLTILEFALLTFLIKNHDKLCTREQLYNAVWGQGYQNNSRPLDTAIGEIRQKLGKNRHLIQTEHGLGYKLLT